MMCHAGFGGVDPASGEYYCFLETFGGGYGGRAASDGPDAVQTHGQNTENAPVEETELNYPVRVDAALARRRLRGAGPLPRRARPAQGLPLRPADDVHGARRPHRRAGRRARSAGSTAASRSTCSCAAARSGGSARRRRSSSRRATRSATARAAAAATARRRSATRSACCATCSRARSRSARAREVYGVVVEGGARVATLTVDPITFEVIRNALVAATDEMVLALKRSAYSTNIKTRSDFSCAFFDARAAVGRAGVRAAGAPRLDGRAGAERGPRVRRREPRAGRHDLTNDPYPSGVHLNDVSLIAPVYVDGRAARLRREPRAPRRRRRRRAGAHRRVPRGVPGGRDHPAGEARRAAAGSWTTSSGSCSRRSARSTRRRGDFRAQIAANKTGVRRVQALVDAARPRDARSRRWTELLAYTERRTLAELAALPHGVYEAEGVVDNDGYTDEPVRLQRAGRARAPDGARFDTTGSDPQRRAPVNSTYAMTFSACAYALKCLIDPDLPVNDGFYRLIDVRRAARARSTNARWPAAVVGGWETHDRLVEVIIRALLPAFPDRLMAGTKGMMCQAGFGIARRGDRGRTRASTTRSPAATAARFASDGPDAVQAHGQNTENAPIEETELNYPVRIPRLSLVENSEGAGPLPRRARAAQGLPLRPPDDVHDPRRPRPLRAVGRVRRARRARRRVRPRPRRRRDAARLEGDGRARARRRDQRAHVRRRRLRPARGARPGGGARDVAEGKVSAERARDVYRVALRDGAVDEAATAELRA